MTLDFDPSADFAEVIDGTESVTLLRRAFKYAFAFAFAVALSASLWGWVARIAGFATRNLSRNLGDLWAAAKDLWYLLQLLIQPHYNILPHILAQLWRNSLEIMVNMH